MSESNTPSCSHCLNLIGRFVVATHSNAILHDKLAQLESKIRELNEEIDELRGYNGTLAMRCKRLVNELHIARTGRPVED